MARPTKLDEKVQKVICDRLKAGCTRKAAAVSAGIVYVTFLDWLQKGEQARSGALREFFLAVEEAEAEAEVRATLLLTQAGQGYDGGYKQRTVKTEVRTKRTRHPDGTVVEEPVTVQIVTETEHTEKVRDWRATESWLKRRKRKEWGDKLDQELTGADGGPVVSVKILNGVSMKDLDP